MKWCKQQQRAAPFSLLFVRCPSFSRFIVMNTAWMVKKGSYSLSFSASQCQEHTVIAIEVFVTLSTRHCCDASKEKTCQKIAISAKIEYIFVERERKRVRPWEYWLLAVHHLYLHAELIRFVSSGRQRNWMNAINIHLYWKALTNQLGSQNHRIQLYLLYLYGCEREWAHLFRCLRIFGCVCTFCSLCLSLFCSQHNAKSVTCVGVRSTLARSLCSCIQQ